MRILCQASIECKVGDTRIKRGFLYLPKYIGGEIRWLEKASWRQIYRLSYTILSGQQYTYETWVTTNWVDSE